MIALIQNKKNKNSIKQMLKCGSLYNPKWHGTAGSLKNYTSISWYGKILF